MERAVQPVRNQDGLDEHRPRRTFAIGSVGVEMALDRAPVGVRGAAAHTSSPSASTLRSSGMLSTFGKRKQVDGDTSE